MASSRMIGQCASPGFASGVVARLGARSQPGRRIAGGSDAEAAALAAAIASAISGCRALAEAESGDAAEMLGFQIALLEDDALSEGAYAAIAGGASADAAWSQALDGEIAGYEASGDEYFRARAADLADLKERVLDALGGGGIQPPAPGSIVFADDITPSRFLTADWSGGAILLGRGSAASHVAMLARARGVPMIVGLAASAAAGDIAGRPVLVDAAGGGVVVDPTPADRAAFLRSRAASEAQAAEADALLFEPAATRDGARILTLINVGDPSELDALDPAICDGVGLVRTELLFEGAALPGEAEQADAYRRIVRWAAGRPVTFRTLDAGGDKPIPGLTPVGESNPFLGVRGVRLTLRRKDVFLTQLRALARAAAEGDVEVMIPMVSTPHELEASRALLAEACAQLAAEGAPHAAPRLGMMVEVPAAALTLERFDAAFLSIGSNDLTQYVMAAGRDIADVAALADPGDPAVLRLIGMVAEHGARTGRKVSLCGDAGGDERLIPLLLREGVRILSMSPRLLARAKRAIAQVDLGAGAGSGAGLGAGSGAAHG